jgi:hypothetical protein
MLFYIKQFVSDWGGPLLTSLWVGLMVYSSRKYQKGQEMAELRTPQSINDQTKNTFRYCSIN